MSGSLRLSSGGQKQRSSMSIAHSGASSLLLRPVVVAAALSGLVLLPASSLSLSFSSAREWGGGCEGAGPPPPLPQVPCLEVPKCSTGQRTRTSPFAVVIPDPHWSSALRTDVSICHSETGFEVMWALETAVDPDAPNFTACHDTVWEADAAEFYIAPSAPGAGTTMNYTEVDVGPHMGAVWLGRIYNPSGFEPDPSSFAHLPECAGSGVESNVSMGPAGWNATVHVPYAFAMGKAARGTLGSGGSLPPVWRSNFYRWAFSPHQLTGWHNVSCEGHGECNPPHVPSYFGVLVLL